MSQRLDEADAAVVGRVVAKREGQLRGAPQLVLTIDVEQRVKGRHLGDPIVVRSPLHTDCDVTIPAGKTRGFLLTRAPDGALLATACSVVNAAELVAAGGEPRGGVIKVFVGFGILGLVMLWALRRLRRGTRPDLPGAPRP
jgi:MYXO-CTERM domain-containing protein